MDKEKPKDPREIVAASSSSNVANGQTIDQDIAVYSDDDDELLEEDMDALEISHTSGDLLETSHTSDASQWETSRADKHVQSVKSRNNNAWLAAGSGTESLNKSDARSRRRSRSKGTSGMSADEDEHGQENGRGVQIVNLDLYVDDWENDDDVGYIYVNLSDDEFFAMVEEVGSDAWIGSSKRTNATLTPSLSLNPFSKPLFQLF